MDDNSNDLYNQIMKKLEEKRSKEDLAIRDLDPSKSNDYLTEEESKSKIIAEFLEEQDYYVEEDKKDKKKNKSKKFKKEKKKEKQRERQKEIEEDIEIRKEKRKKKDKKRQEKEEKELIYNKPDVKKTRGLLRALIIIQILLLCTLLYILYNKIFDTTSGLSSNFNSDSNGGIILMEGYLEIPSIDLAENVYENSEKISFNSLILFNTLNGLNEYGNSAISSITNEGYLNKDIFSKLNKINVDDKIYISIGESDSLEYNVVEVKEVDETDLEVLVSTEKISLTLIGKGKDKLKRLIIKAEAVEKEVKKKESKPKNLYRVTTNDLNVRPKPSFNNTPKGTLNTGDTVEVISKKGDWYEIKYENGKAYVSATYLKKISQTTTSVSKPIIEIAEKQLTNLQKKYEKLP